MDEVRTGSTYGPGYRPHITLAIGETSHPGRLARRVARPVARVAGTPVMLSGLGFFLTERVPAYLSGAVLSPAADPGNREVGSPG